MTEESLPLKNQQNSNWTQSRKTTISGISTNIFPKVLVWTSKGSSSWHPVESTQTIGTRHPHRGFVTRLAPRMAIGPEVVISNKTLRFKKHQLANNMGWEMVDLEWLRLWSLTISGCWTKTRDVAHKLDGENNGKPYFLMDDLGVPLFLETPKWDNVPKRMPCRLVCQWNILILLGFAEWGLWCSSKTGEVWLHKWICEFRFGMILGVSLVCLQIAGQQINRPLLVSC